MTRRQFVGTSAAVAAAQTARGMKPNVVVILADDLGYQDLSCTGSDYVKTPNIDELTRTGARFTNWYSNAPVCAPSRGALLTGRYPQRNGVTNNGLSLAATEKTIASVLKQAGYATALTGKWHLGSSDTTCPNAHGFDYFYGFHSGCVDFFSHRYYWGEPQQVNYHDLWRNRTEIFEDGLYLTDRIAAEAAQFIASNRQRPFFLYSAFNAPHYPMHAPAQFMNRFKGLAPEKQVRAAMISALDDGVGRIVGTLKSNGLFENTLIFFSSDNGATREPRAGLNQQPPTTGANTPFRGYKFSLFDGGMHVPEILSWPGRIAAGKVDGRIAAHMDVFPTICGAAGVDLPEDRVIDGHNVLRGESDTIYWSSGAQLAVRQGHWKLVMNGFEAAGTPESRKPLQGEDAAFLSNLEDDPAESRNRRREFPKIAEELETAAKQWLAGIK